MKKFISKFEDLPKNWQDELLVHYESGGSNAKARLILNVSRRTWYDWLKNNEMFRDVVFKGYDLAQVHFEEKCMSMIDGTIKGSPFMLTFIIKNRFSDYADKLLIDEKLKDQDDPEEMTEKEEEFYREELAKVKKMRVARNGTNGKANRKTL